MKTKLLPVAILLATRFAQAAPVPEATGTCAACKTPSSRASFFLQAANSSAKSESPLAWPTIIPEPAIPATYLAGIEALLDKPWPQNRTVNIVCHGHSVPAGYFHTPLVDTFNAYPHLLHEKLKTAHPNAVINVIVTSIGGENSVQGAARFERDVLALRPDVVTIDYALNDRRVGLDKARAAWTEMITKAKAAGIKVILLTPSPDKSAKLDDPNDPLNQHAAQIRKLAAEHGVALSDSLAGFQKLLHAGTQLDSLMSQINHPNRQGHDLIAGELVKWFPKHSH